MTVQFRTKQLLTLPNLSSVLPFLFADALTMHFHTFHTFKEMLLPQPTLITMGFSMFRRIALCPSLPCSQIGPFKKPLTSLPPSSTLQELSGPGKRPTDRGRTDGPADGLTDRRAPLFSRSQLNCRVVCEIAGLKQQNKSEFNNLYDTERSVSHIR